MNNRTLLYIFLACLLVFFGAKFLRKEHTSSFDPVISAVDSTKVDRIRFVSGGPDKEEFELVKSDTSWEAVKGQKRVAAPSQTVNAIISQLSDFNADLILTKDPSKYAGYEITDDMASRVIVYQGDKELTHLLIGGFRFDQATRSATAFVRKNDQPEVFQVDGFAIMSLRQNFDQYRDRTLVKADPNDLTRIEWMNASGRKEVITKEAGIWHYAGMEAVDTSAINAYLQSMTNTRGTEFSDNTPVNNQNPLEKLTLYGNNMIEPVTLSVYQNQDTIKTYLIHSSVNPDAFFLSDSTGIYRQIFSELRQFWPNGK